MSDPAATTVDKRGTQEERKIRGEQKRKEQAEKMKQLLTVTIISQIAEFAISNAQSMILYSTINSTFSDAVINFCVDAWRNIVTSQNALPSSIISKRASSHPTKNAASFLHLRSVLIRAVGSGQVWLVKKLFQCVNYDSSLLSANFVADWQPSSSRSDHRGGDRYLLWVAIVESVKYSFTVGGKHATKEIVDFLLRRTDADPWLGNAAAVKAAGDEYMKALIYEIERQEGAVTYDENDDDENNHNFQKYDSTEFDKIAQGIIPEKKKQDNEQERPRSYILFDIFEDFLGHFPHLKKLDRHGPTSPEYYDYWCHDMLLHFSKTGNYDIVKLLLEKCIIVTSEGTQLNKDNNSSSSVSSPEPAKFRPKIAIDENGRNPTRLAICEAIYNNNEDIATLLIQKGASLRKGRGFSAPLLLAARTGMKDFVRALIEEGRKRYADDLEGFKRDFLDETDGSRTSQATALMAAIASSEYDYETSKEIIQMLLDAGASVSSIVNFDGDDAFALVCKNYKISDEILKMLFKAIPSDEKTRREVVTRTYGSYANGGSAKSLLQLVLSFGKEGSSRESVEFYTQAQCDNVFSKLEILIDAGADVKNKLKLHHHQHASLLTYAILAQKARVFEMRILDRLVKAGAVADKQTLEAAETKMDGRVLEWVKELLASNNKK